MYNHTLENTKENVNSILEEYLMKKNLNTLEDLPSSYSYKYAKVKP